MNQEIIDLVVKLVIAVVSVLITGYFIPWIKSLVDSTKYNDLLTMVEMCVEAANQIYTPEEWEKKKSYVVELVCNYAADHKVNITMSEINALIEGFVKAVKG